MAGHERIGRQTPAGGQGLFSAASAPAPAPNDVTPTSGMRARDSNLPSVSAPLRRAPPKTGANIDPDDDAETRLYRPHLTIPRPNAMTGNTTIPERASLTISGAPRSAAAWPDRGADLVRLGRCRRHGRQGGG